MGNYDYFTWALQESHVPIVIITQDAQNDVLSYFWVLLNTVVKKTPTNNRKWYCGIHRVDEKMIFEPKKKKKKKKNQNNTNFIPNLWKLGSIAYA